MAGKTVAACLSHKNSAFPIAFLTFFFPYRKDRHPLGDLRVPLSLVAGGWQGSDPWGKTRQESNLPGRVATRKMAGKGVNLASKTMFKCNVTQG